ncbi:uncharacterized protein LOC131227453 [Magnolia sinica]|uniref:uncharacterized protein LOC131227453 n=1 Tax=Magnolia sinica TaxID=86752 RepID=UPI00265AB7C3|nr:uncharacterized protein LOC131227453 [Magnolia sinica]
MEKRNLPAADDELLIVKAAAWAWYQHGSGCERRLSREFDLSRTSRALGSSRFKLEAMRDVGRLRLESSNSIMGPYLMDISLFDSYDIDRISRKLDCLLRSTSSSYDPCIGDGQDRRKSSARADEALRKKKVWKLNGFWLRHAMGMCGSRRDVVENKVLGGRLQSKDGLVVVRPHA